MVLETPRDLSRFLKTEIMIGKQRVPNRLFLAPMAGLGHIAFRHLVSEFGGFGLLFTGMCSAKAVPHENPKFSNVFTWRKEELSHTVCQIFGSAPEDMAAAAKRIEREGFFGVDLNFGCSVAAICKKGAGAALLKTPDTARKIVDAVRQAVSCPVFVKYRTGWENNPDFPAQLARKFEASGADALVFHPRVAPDRRSRPPQWDIITRVRQTVSIPVFGNGNLFDTGDALKMTKTTGCQGLSIGRMAVAKPWIFAEWTGRFKPDTNIYHTTALRMTHLLDCYYTDAFAVKMFKKFAPYFCANFKFAHATLKHLMRADTMDEIRRNIDHLFIPPPETQSRPNIHLFLG